MEKIPLISNESRSLTGSCTSNWKSRPVTHDLESNSICNTKVRIGTYQISSPLIKPSKLTSKSRGGIGKELSNGWALNFAVGCTHGCVFCYVDSIHKRYGKRRYGALVNEVWGNYFLMPTNMDGAISNTPWSRWAREEVLLSSTHDPYLPQLAPFTRKILENALPSGVRFCIQTRSPLVTRDFDLLSKYKNNIRLQVSIATMHSSFSRLIEPRVASSKARINILKRAKELNLKIGIIIAPIFPPLKARPDVEEDLDLIMREIARIKPDHLYGESLHIRGENINLLRCILKDKLEYIGSFDFVGKSLFERKSKEYALKGTWWPEHRNIK